MRSGLLAGRIRPTQRILVAVAMSRNIWIVMTGGILGLVAMRVIAAQLLRLVERYPSLVDAAFIIIAWIGIALSLEYLYAIGFVHFEVSKTASLALVVGVFAVAYLYARAKGPVAIPADDLEEQAAELLASGADVTQSRQVRPL